MLIPLRDDDADGAQAAYKHALLLFQQGRLDATLAEASAGWNRYHGRDSEWAGEFQILLARTLYYMGQGQQALDLLSVNPGRDADPDGGVPDRAVQKLSLEGGILTQLGQTDTAEKRLEEAEAICRKAELVSCGGVWSARWSLAKRLGQMAEARMHIERAFRYARDHHDPWRQANASLNLGYMALQADRPGEAIDWSRGAYQLAMKQGYDDVAQNAAGNLGFAYYQLGDGERALEQFEAAEKSAAELGDFDDELLWLSDASYVYRDRGETERAEELERKALALATKINSEGGEANALGDLAALGISSGKLKDADERLQAALRMETAGGRSPRPIFVLLQGQLAAAQHAYDKAEGLFRSVLSDKASPIAVRLSAGNDLGRMYEEMGRFAPAERMYQATIVAWDAARAQLQREEWQLSFGTNVSEIYRNYVRFLVHRGRTAEALAVADRNRARTLAEGLGMAQKHERAGFGKPAPEALHPEQIARRRGATLLFYWLGDEESYLWAIGPETAAFLKLPAEREITARVAKYNKAILNSGDPAEAGNADGLALYEALAAPARKVLDAPQAGATQDEHRSVIVLADGALNQLNFETLLVPGVAGEEKQTSGPEGREDSLRAVAGAKAPAYQAPAYRKDPVGQAAGKLHYLVEDYTVLEAPSLDLLAHGGAGLAEAGPEKTDAKEKSLLLMGNAAAADPDFPPLPLFGAEMKRVASHFGAGEEEILAGGQATPAAYAAANPENYAYIHFVSHATASRTSPLDSAIILSNPAASNAAGSAGDGASPVSAYKLYAREIVEHPLEARLVTISACYGSGTRAYAGEGLVGLSWAFLRAGARQVVAALWEVTDESTPRLMDGLYAGIAAGRKPAEALREAKLKMLHSGTEFREPFYWAPFVIYSRD